MIKIAVCDDETCIADILGEKITEFFEKKDFYTGKVSKNAVKWEFFGNSWCLKLCIEVS